MATHSSILVWKVPWTEKPWPTVHRIKELDTTEQLSAREALLYVYMQEIILELPLSLSFSIIH